MGIAGFLQLNEDGKRFMNEDVPGQQIENQIEMQKDMCSWQFWDANWKEELQYMPAGHGVACYYDNSTPKNNANYRNYKSDAKLKTAIDEGRCLTANSIDELLAKIDNIDVAEAAKSIERYNQLASSGKDSDFSKVSSRLFPLDTPPFYCCKMTTALMLVCLGGLESDEDAHVYDNDRNIIEGLYAAGNIQGDRFASEYPISLKGVSHALGEVGRFSGLDFDDERGSENEFLKGTQGRYSKQVLYKRDVDARGVRALRRFPVRRNPVEVHPRT